MKDNTAPVSEMAEQALKSYEQALRTGLKLQQDAVQWWSNSLQQEDWQQRLSGYAAAANGIFPVAQKRVEELLALAEKNRETYTQLMRKAAVAAQTPVMADSQAKWMEFWESSMQVAQSNAQAMAEFNAKIFDACVDFVQKNTEVTSIRVPKVT